MFDFQPVTIKPYNENHRTIKIRQFFLNEINMLMRHLKFYASYLFIFLEFVKISNKTLQHEKNNIQISLKWYTNR